MSQYGWTLEYIFNNITLPQKKLLVDKIFRRLNGWKDIEEIKDFDIRTGKVLNSNLKFERVL